MIPVDTYHGVEVADPFRWLEKPDSPQTRAWIAQQNEATESYLAEVPGREAIRARLTELWDHPRYGIPVHRGGRYFYLFNDGLQPQSALLVADALDAEPRTLLDPNTLSEDGTIALGQFVPSPDGALVAYAISSGGSDWVEWRVRDVATGEDLADTISWSKFSGAEWSRDGSGFYYSRYDAPADGQAYQGINHHQKLYHHRIGTSQSDDRLVYERPDEKEWGFHAVATDDARLLVLTVWRGTEQTNLVFTLDLTVPGAQVVELIDTWDAKFELIGSEGDLLWFRTTLDAPRGRVVGIDLASPGRNDWREVIPQCDDTLEVVSRVGGYFVARYLSHASSAVRVFDRAGRHVRDVDLPDIGTVEGFEGDGDDPETFFSFTGFTTPLTVFRYDVATGEQEVFRRPEIDVDLTRFQTRQVFYESKDGTRIPMFLVHRRGLEPTGDHPTYLYGYGGFNVSLTPGFAVHNLVWMEMGGVYAVANLRGGGEYGEDWHEAGTRLSKQNVFDDFIAGAQWLLDQGYTCRERLAIAGGSNGGLLIGACMTQRPDLFGACLPAVGVLDMLRYHQFTIGWAWESDYGSVADPDEFRALFAYSPLHNLRPGTCYPPTLVTTGDHDDRVVPAHSFKFAAALQEAIGCDHPALIRIGVRAGHGAGKPTAKVIAERADILTFLVRVFGMEVAPGTD